MANPKSVLRNLYGEIIQGNFSNAQKFKRLMQYFMESAKIDEYIISDFNNAIDGLPNSKDELVLITEPLLEKIYEWFKEEPVIKKSRRKKSVWEKMMEDDNPGLTKHKKRLQRRKKR